jgi:hypothetical protein
MKLNGSEPGVPVGLASAAPAAQSSAGGTAAPFLFAREHGEHASEINEFYNRFTGKSRSLAAHRWEFQAGPDGPALVWTITDTLTQRVVGHHSIVRTPLVRRGVTLTGGRTENTIIDPAVRTKVFYPGMEKRALAETLQSLRVVYTIHSTGPGRLRERLGYKTVGRWVLYVPKAGPGYLGALMRRGTAAAGVSLPAVLLRAGAQVISWVQAAGRRLRGGTGGLQLAEIDSIGDLGQEYEDFWARARARYDVTLDRSLPFLRWRVADNPHLAFRTWTVRSGGRLAAVVIAHKHALGAAGAVYVDDIIVGDYDDASFAAVLRLLPALDPAADAVVLMTLDVDTPLMRALRKRFPLQSYLLQRYGARLFDEMLAIDKDGVVMQEPWYVTALFTEGMDTSREGV